jgi:4-azaleucine resistance transporter AzlC
MRSTWRTLREQLGPALLRDVALVALAVGVVGASYGAITVSEGFPWWTPTVMSVLVFGGASQFLFTGIVGAGGSAAAAVVAGLLVNARHLPFGFAMADVLGDKWHRRLLGSYVLIDEVVAFSLAQKDPERRRWTYAFAGLSLMTCWHLGCLVGALAGTAIQDTDAFGLDAAFPAILLALVLPGLRDPGTRSPALVGAAIAVATTPYLPVGLPVLAALIGLLVAVRRPARPAERATA